MAKEPQRLPKTKTNADPQASFLGFHPPTSNVTGTPNQYFDVLMPICSGPAFKIAGYMIRRTLGWIDAFGNPQEEQLSITHSEVVAKAGLGAAHVRSAFDELIELNAITCDRQPQPPRPGSPAVVGLYSLKWDARPQYITDPARFAGFFDGEGNFTYIPNQYFDEILPSENSSIAKVVAVVARYSIGYKSQRGTRRRFTRASLGFVQSRANMARSTAVLALKAALKKNYLLRFSEGVYGHDKAAQIAATYGLKWLDKDGFEQALHDDGEVGVPPKSNQVPPKSYQGVDASQIELDTSEIGLGSHLPNRPRTASQIEPETYLPNQSNIKTTRKKLLKQQQRVAVGSEVVSLLTDQGLSEKNALWIAKDYPEDLIRSQVEWLPERSPRNPAGMLRRAIKENWEAPVSENVGAPTSTHGAAFAAAFYAGYAGNQDAPTARPSKAEISLSNSYIEQILKMWPEAPLIEAHGRSFGEYVREHKPPSRDFRATFSVALRLFGDEFYKKLNHQRVAETRKRVEAARATHRKKHLQAYRDFVQKEEKRLRRRDSARYSEFLEKRAEDRDRVERNPFIHDEEARAQNLADHDADRARLNDFLEFFCDDVADFWTWDKDQNPKSFERATSL